MSTADVLIAGGGIIGLSTALELAGRGLRVTVLERGCAMAEASWAAAGMLAAFDPENPADLRPLSELSISLYPDYLNTIERLSRLQVPLRTSRTLQGSERNHIFSNALSAAEIAACVPDLDPESRSFLWLKEHSLDPRDLCAALPKAAVAAGISIIEHSPITEVRAMASVVDVRTPQATWSASHFINCCGAWAGAISHLPSIEPRKGQMVTVKLPPSHRLDCVIRTPELYLVPRGDGRIVIGASVERAGFDKSVEETTIQALLDQAAALWPPIRQAQIVETWAGLRPGSADGLPIMDACGEGSCWIASGHFRNGILLAPGTARIMRNLILGEPPSVHLAPFRCDRFAAASVP
ncbi:FAD-dependent oxidoreductase [Alloacidobacterium dinghuense]|uniref:FAD-dependent oxidoreductase n=1 Tax=Alloacidobacterium dinghuense TaxID=2763107 RepID=A0A7G8BL99_9BACT|nr:FAD-dependent oxidoreductase [Alloacidobacterium dinghuense]QNI33319.1 FAD-dependent oxidoreductase [Alloacidobacterium dinghuense]